MAAKRLTQEDIARLAGVSQATVSLVLNDAAAAAGRIPRETRDRVEKAIRETGYVADPIARRMASGQNRILGVFTYEPAFPSEQADFFTPFLLGIEEVAEELGYDLLLLTGASGERKRIFGEKVRLRLADGCLILGRDFDHDELRQLVAGSYPFVAIGRREDAGGPVPYVGGDYFVATRELVERAVSLGHSRLGYIGAAAGAESTVDRWRGFSAALSEAGRELVLHVADEKRPVAETLELVLANGATALFFVELADAVEFHELTRRQGLAVPGDLSIIVLGSHRRAAQSGTKFASYLIPREEMGRQAARMLVRRIEVDGAIEQVLLPCTPFPGDTLNSQKNER